MSPDRLVFKTPEVPQGEELFKKTVDFARKSIVETYPVINQEPYSSSLPTMDKIELLPNRQMQEIEHNETVTDNVLIRNLIAAGLSPNFLNGDFTTSSKTFVYRDSQARILVSTEALIDISSGEDIDRIRSAYFLGLMLIQDCIKNAPTKRTLPPLPWREVVKKSIKNDIFDVLKDTNNEELQIEKIATAEIAENTLIDTKGKFTAQGGMVTLSFTHHGPSTEEYHIGTNLNDSLAFALANEPMVRLTTLFNNAFLNRFKAIPPKKSPESVEAERFCTTLGIPPRKRDFPKGQSLPQDFNNHRLIDYYLESLVPIYHIASDKDSKHNPWSYPS